MPDQTRLPRAKAPRPKPLLSHSSILVLTGYVIGAGSSDMLGPDLALRVKISGLMGLAGFYAITYLAEKRRIWMARLARERATHQIESRMHRHIPKPAFRRIVPTFRRAKFSPQYLPVARARNFVRADQARD